MPTTSCALMVNNRAWLMHPGSCAAKSSCRLGPSDVIHAVASPPTEGGSWARECPPCGKVAGSATRKRVDKRAARTTGGTEVEGAVAVAQEQPPGLSIYAPPLKRSAGWQSSFISRRPERCCRCRPASGRWVPVAGPNGRIMHYNNPPTGAAAVTRVTVTVSWRAGLSASDC